MHIKGNDRKQIIDFVLTKYLIDEKGQIIKVDLSEVMNEILEAHKPLSEHFRFLCSECHRKHDKIRAISPLARGFNSFTRSCPNLMEARTFADGNIE